MTDEGGSSTERRTLVAAVRAVNRGRLAEARRRGSGSEAFEEAARVLGLSCAGGSDPVRLRGSIDRALGGPSKRLAVYGSLAPGEVNAHVLAELQGSWALGRVRGVLHSRGWGSGQGFPGLEWDPRAGHVEVRLFVSDGLPEHWPRLDAFEGGDYLRSLIPVCLLAGDRRNAASPGVVVANAYLLRSG